jgi:transcriptional regulator with XRE-family HTH domain
MKRSYTPTDTDALTGHNLRALRQRRGETLKQTVENSGFVKDASTLAATERGERLLTDLEATKLAAHFNTTADTIRAIPAPEILSRRIDWTPATEQDWLGNGNTPEMQAADEAWRRTDTTPLFAVPEQTPVSPLHKLAGVGFGGADLNAGVITIDRSNPMHPDEYRAQVWIPYLEARYTTDTKAS